MKNKKSMLTDDKARIGYQDGTKVKNKDLEVMLVDLEFTASQITELMDMAEDEREKIIVVDYFGLMGTPKTLSDIGLDFSLTKERVRQIKEKALRKLRNESETLLDYMD